jgi:hypothetical protein
MAVTVFRPAIHLPAQFSLIGLGFSEALLLFSVNMSQLAKFFQNRLEKLADVGYGPYSGNSSLMWSECSMTRALTNPGKPSASASSKQGIPRH